MSDKMDLIRVCRTCLRIPKTPITLFSNDGILVQKIKDIFSLQLENVQELPTQICEECYNLIKTFDNFKKVVVNTDADLKARLNTLRSTNYLSKQTNQNCTNTPTVMVDTKPENNTNNRCNIKISRLKYKKIHKCTKCDQEFTTSLRLNIHRRTSHGSRGVCNICGIEIRMDNMARHLLKHNGTPVRCDVCGKLCKHMNALRSHHYYQHKEKICACEICGATFTMLCALKSHMIHHNDPHRRRKTCHICGTTVNSIKKHMLTHTGERPYRCTYCNKGFTSSHALKVHTRLHTNERPYACTYCDAAYPQIVSLRTHLKSKHGIVNAESVLVKLN